MIVAQSRVDGQQHQIDDRSAKYIVKRRFKDDVVCYPMLNMPTTNKQVVIPDGTHLLTSLLAKTFVVTTVNSVKTVKCRWQNVQYRIKTTLKSALQVGLAEINYIFIGTATHILFKLPA